MLNIVLMGSQVIRKSLFSLRASAIIETTSILNVVVEWHSFHTGHQFMQAHRTITCICHPSQ